MEPKTDSRVLRKILPLVMSIPIAACTFGGKSNSFADGGPNLPNCTVSRDKWSCAVSFYALASNPLELNSNHVSFTGFLAVSNGRLMLFPTELDYRLGNIEAALNLRASPELQREYFNLAGYRYAFVTGIFYMDLRRGMGTELGEVIVERLVPRHLSPQSGDLTEFGVDVLDLKPHSRARSAYAPGAYEFGAIEDNTAAKKIQHRN